MTPSSASDPLAHHLLSMAYNNAWANHRLLAACAQLSPSELQATRCNFFPSILATLNHNLCVDWFYVDALERELAGDTPHPDCSQFFAVAQPFQTAAELQREQAAVDQRLRAYCATQRDCDLGRIVTIARPAGAQQDSRTRLLAHLFQHQIHHRGQVHAMLAGTAIRPPQLDEFFCAGEANLRAEEFRALGWTEADIWG
ncbi:MAG: damage-inducible protein DinB [Burkholderiales bacterium PBB2]|nr:MAG: damage-inducible protein DinB [Burkholderiales bacterium PBB2]